jgi:hypothetical protein
MSDAALAIWISCGSLVVSAGSLVVSVAAYRRSDTLRRFDRLSERNRDIADQLERTIPEGVQSRARVSAALSHGLGGGMEGSIPKRPDYAGIETKSVTARQVSTRLEQLVQYMRDRAGRPR